MSMRVSPVRVTHHTSGGGAGRLVPISRSPYSFFEPSWDVGTWHDFGPIYQRMEEHMRQMNREIDQMFRRFQRLMPLDHFTPNLAALTAPGGMGMGLPATTTPMLHAGTTPMALAVHHSPSLPEPTWCTAPAIPPMPEMPRMNIKPLTMADEWKLENPIVTEKDGSRHMRLEFDVRQFRPEEVNVRTQDNQLTVFARHQEEGPNGRIFREFHRQFVLPHSVKLETLSSVLSPEGVLTVTAPMSNVTALPEPSRERIIPIEYIPK